MNLKEARAATSNLNANLDEDQVMRVAILVKEIYSEAYSKGKREGYQEAKEAQEYEIY